MRTGASAIGTALIATLLCALLTPAAAPAAPPLITATGFSEVTGSSATLTATVDPGGAKVKPFRFDYISQADYEAAGNSFGAGTISTPDLVIPAGGPQPVAVAIEGLTPATAYRFRAFAENNQTKESAFGPERSFQTRVPAPVFGPCANDLFRSGPGTPEGHPGAALPDCRAYERATPAEKDGGDAHGLSTLTRAAGLGAGIVWGSNFGAPGGDGAQELPFFAALRSPDGSGWSSQGLLPPAALGAAALVRGWLPDFSEVFAEATRLGEPRTTALFELHRDGRAPTQITPYLEGAGSFFGAYSYVGASSDGETVVFESPVALPASAAGGPQLPGAKEGGMNVYAWDAPSGEVSLLSRMNSEPENETALPQGAFAGPYDWAVGRTDRGGSSNRYYLAEQHALSPDADSAYFTAYGTGQLYRRVNPTAPQSAIDAGKCTEPSKACTIHVSATNAGTPPDPTGAAPAAFQYASPDGALAYFTSSEELTKDANTGPNQPPAQIGHADLTAPDPDAAKDGPHPRQRSRHRHLARRRIHLLGRPDHRQHRPRQPQCPQPRLHRRSELHRPTQRRMRNRSRSREIQIRGPKSRDPQHPPLPHRRPGRQIPLLDQLRPARRRKRPADRRRRHDRAGRARRGRRPGRWQRRPRLHLRRSRTHPRDEGKGGQQPAGDRGQRQPHLLGERGNARVLQPLTGAGAGRRRRSGR